MPCGPEAALARRHVTGLQPLPSSQAQNFPGGLFPWPRSPRRPAVHKIKQTQCFIGGEWVPAASGKTFDTDQSGNRRSHRAGGRRGRGRCRLGGQSCSRGLRERPVAKMDARDRGRLMHKLADLIEEEIDELAALETLDNGKPIREARHGDLPLTIDCLRYYAGWADKIHGQTIPIRGNYFCYTRASRWAWWARSSPGTSRMLMTAWKWGPALAAGCTIVMKPAEQTPLTCLRMARLGPKGRHSRRRDQRRAGLRSDGRRSRSSSIRASTRWPSPANTRPPKSS